MLEKSDGTKKTLSEIAVSNGGESINFPHLDLSPSTTYNYKLELFTYDMMIKSTSVYICKGENNDGTKGSYIKFHCILTTMHYGIP